MSDSNTTGQIQNAGFISLESDKSDWIKFADLLNPVEFKTTALLDLSQGAMKKQGRINLVINKILSPKAFMAKTNVSLGGRLPKDVSLGLIRAIKHFSDSLDKNAWLFFGYIEGKTRVYILIINYDIINTSIYALKPKDEEMEAFFGRVVNPQDN